MKHLTIIFCLLPLFALSQFSLNFRGGKSKLNPVASLFVAYQYSERAVKPFIEGGMITHLDQTHGAYFGGNAGIELGNRFRVAPFAGYYYKLESNDQKHRNGTTCNFGLRFRYAYDHAVTPTLEVNRMDEMFIVMAGVNIKL